MSNHSDCQTGQCNTGPSPFANTPPIGLSEMRNDDPEDFLPKWQEFAPELPEDCYAMADALWWSRKLGERVSRGEDVTYLLQGEADARAVHNALAASWNWWPKGSVPRYWKSGAPDRSTALVSVPLPEPGVYADGTPAAVPDPVFSLRGVEAEIALRIGQEVTAEQAAALTPDNAAALIDAYAVAIEWVDCRWRESTQAPALALLADGQCHGGLALSPWQDFAPLRSHDWNAQRCTLKVNEEAVHVFTGTHSLQDPTWLLSAWLQQVTSLYGTVPAGTVVTTGTWSGCPQVQAGDKVTVTFDGLGQVDWQF